MDLLYVIGTGSKHNNAELKYSLRSIEKYCTGYDRIFIVGYKPDFLNDNVIFVPCEDKYNEYKHKNILNCIQTAVDTTDISEDFVLQSDDHYYCKPYDFNKIPIYYKGLLLDFVSPKSTCPRYHTSLVVTRRILEHYGLPVLNGASHCGTRFNKTLFKSVEDTIIKDAYNNPWGIEPSAMMAALINKYQGLPYIYRRDCKARDCSNEQVLNEKIGDSFCFSCYEKAFNEELMEKLYPNPSKYER